MRYRKTVGGALLLTVMVAGTAVGSFAFQEVDEVKPSTRVTQNAPFDEMAVDSAAALLLQTIGEENAEIRQLAAQQALLRRMGGRENTQIARLFGKWIREHKAGVAMLSDLTRRAGGNPLLLPPQKTPVLGDKMKMLHATMMDHMAAIQTSQQRHRLAGQLSGGMEHSRMIQVAMGKRANLARKHMKQMKAYHNEKNCPMCANMMKNMKR